MTSVENVKEKPSYVFTAKELIDLKIPSQPLLFEPLMETGVVGSLCGGSDSGKSYLCLQLAAALCSDAEEVLGMKINRRHGSTIMVCTEDNEASTSVRLSSLLDGKTVELDKMRFIYETEKLHTKLDQELERMPADLVILDTFGDLLQGNINDSIEVRKFLKPYKKLAKKHQCLILFLHHVGKHRENNSTPSKADVLGSQGIESASRFVLMLKKNVDDTRVLTLVKGNGIADRFKNKGMLLTFSPHLGFSAAGNGTVDFSAVPDSAPTEPDLEQQVLSEYEKLKNYRKVAETLKSKGIKIGKSKVGDIVTRHRPSVHFPKDSDSGQT